MPLIQEVYGLFDAAGKLTALLDGDGQTLAAGFAGADLNGLQVFGPFSAAGPVGGVAGTPFVLLSMFSNNSAGGREWTLHHAASASNPVPGFGAGGANGIALAAGANYPANAVAIDLPNGCYVEPNGGTGDLYVIGSL